jgi:hypothetical protein
MEKFTTDRGKPGILYQGIKYRVYRESKARRTWRCTKKDCKAVCSTDLNDLMIIDGRFEHNHAEPDNRTVQRLKVRQECKRKDTDEPGERQECKRKDTDEPGERPNKIIMGEIARQDSTELVPEDVKSVRQAIYRRRRKTQPKHTTVKRGNTRGATIVRHVF